MNLDKKTIKKLANEIAEETAKKLYYKLIFHKYLPEIKKLEKEKLTKEEIKRVKEALREFKEGKTKKLKEG
jgi:ABC-type uncharacterized transport system substrate-binding protein